MNRPVNCQDEVQASEGLGFLVSLVSFLYFQGFLPGRICGAELSDNLVGLSSNLAVSLFLQHLFLLSSAIGYVAKMTKCLGRAFSPGGVA